MTEPVARPASRLGPSASVFGNLHRDVMALPQRSGSASHVPRATGSEYAIKLLSRWIRPPFLAVAALVAAIGIISSFRLALDVSTGTWIGLTPYGVEAAVNALAAPMGAGAFWMASKRRVVEGVAILLLYFVFAWPPLMIIGGLSSQLDSLLLLGVPMMLAALVIHRAALWGATTVLVGSMFAGARVDAQRVTTTGIQHDVAAAAAPSLLTIVAATVIFAIMVDWLATVLRRAITEERRRSAELDEALSALMEETDARLGVEREAAQIRHVDSLGRLARSVAHDFNNLLTGLVMSLRSAKGACTEPAVELELDAALTLSRRATELTRSLVRFASGRRSEEDVVVDTHLSGAKRVCDAILRDAATLSFELNAPGATVRCAPHELEQIVLNLLVNAADALPPRSAADDDRAPETGSPTPGISPESWTIHVRTSTSRTVEPWQGLDVATDARGVPHGGSDGRFDRPSAPHGWVVVEVEDHGAGIAAAIMGRIFEQHFTTKRAKPGPTSGAGLQEGVKTPHGGSGLGLASVVTTLVQRDGGIGVRSTIGRGTCFRFWLPLSMANDLPLG